MQTRGLRLVIWGEPGLYKSTFAARLPGAVFIDPNGGSDFLGVDVYNPTSWLDVGSYLHKAIEDNAETIVFDEFGDTEELLLEWFLKKHHKEALSEFAHGNGYVKFRSEFNKLHKEIRRANNNGINIVFILHSACKNHTNPEGPNYQKYTPILDKANWNKLRGWSDAVLYFGRPVSIVKGEDGQTIGQQKDSRIFCQQRSAADAKNRFNMPTSISNDRGSTETFLHFVEGTRKLNRGELPGDEPEEIRVQNYVRSMKNGR